MARLMLLRDAFGVDEHYAVPADDLAALRAELAGVRPYVILFTARSGSTFLTHEIAAAGVLSRPNEWFSWVHVRADVERHGGSPADFVRRLVAANRTADGVFGVETNRLMLELFEDIFPLDRIFSRQPRWFLLRRRNLVAQAVSNYLADRSRIFHSYQLDETAQDRIAAVPYDDDELRRYIQNFMAEEHWFVRRLAAMRVAPVPMFYEDIVADPKAPPLLIANVLGVRLPEPGGASPAGNPMRRLSGQKNADFEERFRNRNAEFLRAALLTRAPLLAPVTDI